MNKAQNSGVSLANFVKANFYAQIINNLKSVKTTLIILARISAKLMENLFEFNVN